MASISDLIMQQVKSAAGGIEIPSNIKNQVLGGLSDSILGSLTQTATKAGGVDIVKHLIPGKSDAASSPVTAIKAFLAPLINSSTFEKKLFICFPSFADDILRFWAQIVEQVVSIICSLDMLLY